VENTLHHTLGLCKSHAHARLRVPRCRWGPSGRDPILVTHLLPEVEQTPTHRRRFILSRVMRRAFRGNVGGMHAAVLAVVTRAGGAVQAACGAVVWR
jgi:hypothetical protein